MFGPIPAQFNDPIGEYEIRGLELTGTVTLMKSLELFAGATKLDAKTNGNNGIEIDHMPYTPEFQFQAGGKLTFLKKFRLYADIQYLHDLYQGTTFRTGTFNFTDPGAANKLGDITLVNARLSYLFDYAPMYLKASEVFVAVNNIFDQDYEYAKGYPMPGTTVFGGLIVKFQ